MFVHLHVHSCYSFLDGASDLESLVRRAAELGMPALALTDHNSLAAAVKFSELCEGFGIAPIFGAELTMVGGSHVTLLAETAQGYANLCTLISAGFMNGGRLSPALAWRELKHHAEGLICLTGCRKGLIAHYLRRGSCDQAVNLLEKLIGCFGRENVLIELIDDFSPGSYNLCRGLSDLAAHVGVGMVATNNVHYVSKAQYPIHDVLRCVKAGITLADDRHEARPLNDELFLKSSSDMAKLFAWCPEALHCTLAIAERCRFSLPKHDQLTPNFKHIPDGMSAAAYLYDLAYRGARERYSITPKVTERLEYELNVIETLGFVDYFLTAWWVVNWAKTHGIRSTGRGSAADSIVAFALRLTDVDVIARNLPFARFLAPGKTPDIDLDFQHDRRDDLFEGIKAEFGIEHVAMCCTFHSYWAKGAMRDIGKVLGLPADLLEVLRKHVSGYVAADQIAEAFVKNSELKNHTALIDRCQLLFSLSQQIAGFPRHLGTHSSGVVITNLPISSIGPVTPSAKGIMNIVTLDKDDVETIGAVKLDILCLRILTAVEDAVTDIRRSNPSFNYDKVEIDEETFRMIRSGKAFGVFQLESPAQMNLAMLLHPTELEHLYMSVALIRPGPISSGTVKKFIDAVNGYRKLEILHPLLEPILQRTYGCVVYQEQVIQLIAAMTGWDESTSDKFRKRLTRHHKMGTMPQAREDFIRAAKTHLPDLPDRNADLLFIEIQGWAGLGFIEGHAVSFGITAAKTAAMSLQNTAEFFAGLLNNQPMGFWPSNSLVAEARRRGVQCRMVNINISGAKCVSERDETLAIRLGLCVVSGIKKPDMEAILAARKAADFSSLLDFCIRVPLHVDIIESLILCGAFDDLHEHRRGLLWRLDETLNLARALRQEAGESEQLRLELGHSYVTPCTWEIDDLNPWHKLMWEWRVTAICAGSHPFAWMREGLASKGIMLGADAERQPDGTRVKVAGLNVRPHRPPRKKGGRHLFTSVEDESTVTNVAFYGAAIDRATATVLVSPALVVDGIIKRMRDGVSLEAINAYPLDVREYVVEEYKPIPLGKSLDRSLVRG